MRKISLSQILATVFAIVGCVSLTGCGADPEPDTWSFYGYSFNVRISPLTNESPDLKGYYNSGWEPYSGYDIYRNFEAKSTSFTFWADPEMDVVLKSIELNFDTVSFSDIENGTHTFECGAKLTMISDTEFSVTEMPELVSDYPWCNDVRIKFEMKPSFSLVRNNSGETETIAYEGERAQINLSLFDSYYGHADK